MSQHGVLFLRDGQFHTLTLVGSQWQASPVDFPASLSDLCSLTLTSGFTHLWVLPGITPQPDEQFFQDAKGEWDLFPTWRDKVVIEGYPNELVSVTGFRLPKGGQKQISVIYLHNCSWSWANDDLSPKQLLITLRYTEQGIGVDVGAGTTTVGTNLLKKSVRSHFEWLQHPSIDLSTLPFKDAAMDVISPRDGKVDMSRVTGKKYLHKFDKISAYLRSCAEENVGVGEIEHYDGRDIERMTIEQACKVPGIYRISPYVPDNPLIPSLLWKDAQWVSSPVLKMLKHFGAKIVLHEAWAFPKYAKVLKEWAERLYSARQTFKTDTFAWKHPIGRENARDAVKDVYTSTMGIFTSDTVKGSWKYRPDWHAQIVGGVRALMFYNIEKFASQGDYPIMVYMDALYYTSNERNPEKAVPHILQHKDSLGGYKHEWTLELDGQVTSVLAGNKGINIKLGELNDIADERMEAHAITA